MDSDVGTCLGRESVGLVAKQVASVGVGKYLRSLVFLRWYLGLIPVHAVLVCWRRDTIRMSIVHAVVCVFLEAKVSCLVTAPELHRGRCHHKGTLGLEYLRYGDDVPSKIGNVEDVVESQKLLGSLVLRV